MPIVRRGKMDAHGRRVAIVASRYNDAVTNKLVDGAVASLAEHGIDPDTLEIYWVPGSFEVPQMADRIARKGGVDGIVCLGAIIRGETNHFDMLSMSVIRSVADVQRSSGIPVTYGIVTAENFRQAMERAGGSVGNKGEESARALVEMMSLWEETRGKEA